MIESEPAIAATLAGAHIDRLRLFADSLGSRGETLGLIGPREGARLWTRHLLNSAILAPLIAPRGLVADIGTGGGFPGLVLAMLRPDAHFYLIEAMDRRCSWLREQCGRLELENVEVRHGRAESLRGEVTADQVTARAVTALSKLVPLAAPLLRNNGELLFLKGKSVRQEIDAAQRVLKKYSVHQVRVETLGSGQLAETTQVFRARVRR